MASYTFKEMQDMVLGWLDLEGDTSTVLTNVKNALNVANAERSTEYEWRFMIKAGSPDITTATGTRDYTLATDFLKPLWFYNSTRRESLQYVPLRSLSPTDVYEFNTPTTSSVDQNLYTLTGQNNLRLLFNPSTGDTIKYQYFKQPTEMSSDSDLPDIPWPHSSLLVWDTLLAMKAYHTENDSMAYWTEQQQRAWIALYNTFGDMSDGISNAGQYVKYVEF